jgi:hypothetical protein
MRGATAPEELASLTAVLTAVFENVCPRSSVMTISVRSGDEETARRIRPCPSTALLASEGSLPENR